MTQNKTRGMGLWTWTYHAYVMGCSKIIEGEGGGSHQPNLQFNPLSLDLFICVPFQLHGEHIVPQPFRRNKLLLQIAISVLPGTHLHLSQVRSVRVNCLFQKHNIEAISQYWVSSQPSAAACWLFITRPLLWLPLYRSKNRMHSLIALFFNTHAGRMCSKVSTVSK